MLIGAAMGILAATQAFGPTAADTGRRTASGLWYSVEGAGPTVVLVHGSNLDARSWDRVRDLLVADHRIVRLDLRFHGRSRDGGGPFSFSADVAEVMDAAGVERATIVGHSLGASVALDLALERPDRVDGLVLAGPSVSGRPAKRAPEGFEAMIAALRAGDMAAAGEALARMPVMTLYRRPERQAEVSAMVRENTALFQADRSRMRSLEPAAAGRLRELTMPVLVLLGGRDPTEANDIGAELVAAVGARAETFAACGHLLPQECEAEMATAIRRFTAGR